MRLTISSGAKEVANRNDISVYDISKAFSKGLLMGARGNYFLKFNIEFLL